MIGNREMTCAAGLAYHPSLRAIRATLRSGSWMPTMSAPDASMIRTEPAQGLRAAVVTSQYSPFSRSKSSPPYMMFCDITEISTGGWRASRRGARRPRPVRSSGRAASTASSRPDTDRDASAAREGCVCDDGALVLLTMVTRDWLMCAADGDQTDAMTDDRTDALDCRLTGTPWTTSPECASGPCGHARRTTRCWLRSTEDLQDESKDPAAVIDELVERCDPGLMGIQSGRFFGFVIGSGLPAAIGADWLSSAWDQNAGLVAAAPAAAAARPGRRHLADRPAGPA